MFQLCRTVRKLLEPVQPELRKRLILELVLRKC